MDRAEIADGGEVPHEGAREGVAGARRILDGLQRERREREEARADLHDQIGWTERKSPTEARYPMKAPAKVSPAPVGSLTASRGNAGNAKKRVPTFMIRSDGPSGNRRRRRGTP